MIAFCMCIWVSCCLSVQQFQLYLDRSLIRKCHTWSHAHRNYWIWIHISKLVKSGNTNGYKTHFRTWEAISNSGSPPHTYGCWISFTYVSKSPSINLKTNQPINRKTFSPKKKINRKTFTNHHISSKGLPFCFFPPL